MQFFTWGINKPGVNDRRAGALGEHWNYMDTYDDALIARGPVLDPDDLSVVTGSIHVFDLVDWDAARAFVFDEPFAKNNLFETVHMTRFALELGRTQFEFKSNPDHPRFFIYAPAGADAHNQQAPLSDEHERYCASFDANFVCRGSLLTEAGAWNGSLFLIEVPALRAAEAFLAGEPYNKAGLFREAEVRRWTLGGRANLSPSGSLD